MTPSMSNPLFSQFYAGRSAALLGAAQDGRWVDSEHRINSDNGQTVLDGLTHQHTIKRVPVRIGKRGEVTDTGFIQRQARNLVAYPLGREVMCWGMRQEQLAQGMFDDSLPQGNHAQIDLVPASRMLSRQSAGNRASPLMNQRKIWVSRRSLMCSQTRAECLRVKARQSPLGL